MIIIHINILSHLSFHPAIMLYTHSSSSPGVLQTPGPSLLPTIQFRSLQCSQSTVMELNSKTSQCSPTSLGHPHQSTRDQKPPVQPKSVEKLRCFSWRAAAHHLLQSPITGIHGSHANDFLGRIINPLESSLN